VWRTGTNVCEIQIQCDQYSSFMHAYVHDGRIWFALQSLGHHSQGIITGLDEEFRNLDWQVFINLELHHPTPDITGTSRSLVSSAAYAMAA